MTDASRQIGAARTAARRIGCTTAEYLTSRQAGLRWCPRCKGWIARAAWSGGYCKPHRCAVEREHVAAKRRAA